MQASSLDNCENNVVSIFSRDKKKQCEKIEQIEQTKNVSATSFEEVMRRNAENVSRMKKERAKANQGVIRSYRLKPKT